MRANGDLQALPAFWRVHFAAVLLVLGLSLTAFYSTWASMVAIWSHSQTFTHGFLIIPISLWLIWTQKSHCARLSPAFSYLAVGVVAGSGLVWLLAKLSHVLVIEQFAVVAMLVSGLWAVLGNAVTFALLFPLCFLFFMVPAGEDLVPPLIEFTTSFTVALIRLTGLPIYREGNFFTLTSGSWSVIEACSGINYLIASITLGFVYAYLNYFAYWKRALFLLASVVVPIIANGFRAYLIVMIGHLSNMTLAVGVDHLVYGGVFFGLVILLLFYLGTFWRDPPFTPIAVVSQESFAKTSAGQSLGFLVALSISFLLWPGSQAWLLSQQTDGDLSASFAKAHYQDWQRVEQPDWQWAPSYDDAVAQQNYYYGDGRQIIGIHLASYGREEQGRELVNAKNTLINPKVGRLWRIASSEHVPVSQGSRLSILQSLLTDGEQYFLAFEWYQVGNQLSSNDYQAKLLQLIKRLTADAAPELKVVLWTMVPHQNVEQAKTTLQNFSEIWLKQNGLL